MERQPDCKDGRPIREWEKMLSSLKIICDTLELSPSAIIAGTYNHGRMQSCKRALQEFASAVQRSDVKYARAKNKKKKTMSEAGL
ncbi:hypothetical protein [Nitrososphaera sp.]|uniref:hypothetical protein n=1 Tax=Nitrososphaera sp. TaxID=1971748 RepID=UPI00307CD7DE